MRIIHFSSPLSVDLSFPCFLVSNEKKHQVFSQMVRACRHMLLFHGVEGSWYSTGPTVLTGAVACFWQMACCYSDIWWDYSDTHNDVLQHLWPIQRALSFLLKQVQTNFRHVKFRYNHCWMRSFLWNSLPHLLSPLSSYLRNSDQVATCVTTTISD